MPAADRVSVSTSAACIPLAQQANASSWTGVLRDASRNPVASAKIEIRAVNGHPIRDATTAADGTFLISGITAGAYHISVAYHQRVWSASKSVTLPEDDTISASLQLFSTTQEVLVQTSQKSQSTAPSGRDESGQASGGERLSGSSVSSLPLNARDFSKLLLLVAGTMTDANGAANFTQQFAMNRQRGTVKPGTSLLNFDGFAPASHWAELS